MSQLATQPAPRVAIARSFGMTARAGSLAWFGRHEVRLLWREWVSLWTAGKRSREGLLAVGAVVLLGIIHLFAHVIISSLTADGLVLDKTTLVVVSSSAFLSFSMMVSQVMESVTRAFYARADLDLILSSPTSARRVFTVRMIAIAVSTAALTTVLAGPFINALTYNDGPHWLAAYGVLAAMGAFSTALALVLTFFLFRTLGPKRTRTISQILSAVVGAAFVIGVQVAAVLSTGTFSRVEVFQSAGYVDAAPDVSSLLWWPARAAMGDLPALAAVMAVSFGLLALVIAVFSGTFGDHVIAASGVAHEGGKAGRQRSGFRTASTASVLRRKEWTLLLRDPWLMSQTLMQILYLLPPALLLWVNFGVGTGALLIIVPILVMAAGQLAGGLAWLAVSGEDAPDLVASAPLPAGAVIRAKVEAVIGAVVLVIAPLIAALALASPKLALVALLGSVVSSASGTTIQIWFRAQAKRSNFRRRQTSSRVATLAEALSSILWAGTAALAAAGSWFALALALLATITLAVAWFLSPRRDAGT